jgi:hypothetical protein
MELDASERRRLAAILQCKESEVEKRLAPYAAAALEEYVRMFIGERVYTRGSDIREYRLFLLMANVWQRVPEDHEVSALFQTTAGQSRALIRAVLSKFRYDLAATLEGSLKTTLAAARRLSDSELQLLVRSANLVDALNERIEGIDASLPRLTPGEGVASYRIKQSAYEQLCRVLGVQPKA